MTSKERTISSLNFPPLDSRPLIIGICGGTGSGKTTITRRIIDALTETSVIVLQQDNYYRDYPELSFEERVKVNFDHPDSMDTSLLAEDVRRLRAGQAIERPLYDFANFRRLKGTVRIEPRPAIIVEGILIFESKPLRELMDNFAKAGGTIYVCSPCFKKRKLDENNLVAGASIVGGAKLVEFLSDGSPCVSY